MPGKEAPRPTEAELSILQVLWQRGPSTVREVTEVLQKQRGTGYTTALKLLQIMTEKGLVERDESQRSQMTRTIVACLYRNILAKPWIVLAARTVRFSPNISTARRNVSACFGVRSWPSIVGCKRASKSEFAEIRALLDALESNKR